MTKKKNTRAMIDKNGVVIAYTSHINMFDNETEEKITNDEMEDD